ncbi:MAG: tRNA pseudouridine(13) synthase TruD [Planctomycetes bacterium]|nr:tRNA pseudouridine(13) synthase TruD [Planctomycetota bacterium]
MRGIASPYLTPDLPGIGGTIKAALDDFVVEEVPSYLPCGNGEHAYFAIEKRDLPTLEAIERIAAALGVSAFEIGYAGMKDRKAVAIQHLTVRGISPDAVRGICLPGIRVLWAERHGNKLRIGHLRGNRFRIAIRGIAVDRLGAAFEILEILRSRGVPNYYGPQRFGSRGDAHRIGRAILARDAEAAVARILGRPSRWESDAVVVEARHAFERGETARALHLLPRTYRTERGLLRYLVRPGATAKGALKRLPKTERRIYLSAYQSDLFNRCLARRLAAAAGDLARLWEGDAAILHGSGGAFIVRDVAAEQPRADRFELSASGPTFGKNMLRAEGRQGRIEEEILGEDGIRFEDFHVLMQGLHMRGGRRANRVPVRDLHWEVDGDSLRLSFELPKGAYATVILREVMKNDEPPPAALEDEGTAEE